MSLYKRSQHDYSRNTNFDNIVKVYDSPETSPLDDKKTHPKCKVNLHSRLLSSNESVRADALELYQPGHASSRSSLFSIPSLEWDGRREFVFKTRSLPRQSRKASKGRLFRTNSHAGFANSFLKDPKPEHYHLPRCSSCGAANNSYAWELTKSSLSKRSAELSTSLDSALPKCIDDIAKEKTQEFDVVKVKQKVVPVFQVAVLKGSESEFVESQEFTEDCYFGDMQSSYSSDNMTVIEKTPVKLDALKEQLQEHSPVDDESKMVYNKVVIELKERFEEKSDMHRAEVAVADPDITNYVCVVDNTVTTTRDAVELKAETKETGEEDDMVIDRINSMETMHGDYLNFSDDIDFTQAIYESPVKDLVEKDIRDYSVPINFYYEDYDKEDSKISPRKKREMANATVLEPILEESKSSYGDASNITQGNESGKENSRISESSTDKPISDEIVQDRSENKEVNDAPKTEQPEGTKEAINEVSTCILEEIIDDIYQRDLDKKTGPKNISENILNDICEKALEVSQLKEELSKSAEHKKLTYHTIATACSYNRTPDYFVLEEGSDVTNFNVENVTHTAVETAMEMYLEEAVCQETEVLEDQESIINSVYENIFEIFSKDSEKTESAGKSSESDVIVETVEPQSLAAHLDFGVTEKDVTESVMEDIFVSEPQISEVDNHISENIPMAEASETAIDIVKNVEPQHEEFQFLHPEAVAESGPEVREIAIAEGDSTKMELNRKVSLSSSRGYSLGSTIPEMPSFNATVEFEKYEAVSEVIGVILNKIDYSDVADIDVVRQMEGLKRERNIKLFDSSNESKVNESADVDNESFAASEARSDEDSNVVTNTQNIVNFTPSNEFDAENRDDENETNMQFATNNKTQQITDRSSAEPAEYSPEDDQGTFSMASIVQHYDQQLQNLNDTQITDSSSQLSDSEKIVEAIIYYVFQQTYSLVANKATAAKRNKTKKVVTVVDVEDVLYTAMPLWESQVIAQAKDEVEGIFELNVITSLDVSEDEEKENDNTVGIDQNNFFERAVTKNNTDEDTSKEELDHDVAFCAETLLYDEKVDVETLDEDAQEIDEGNKNTSLEPDLDTAFNITELVENQDISTGYLERNYLPEEFITKAPTNEEENPDDFNMNINSEESTEVVLQKPESDEYLVPESVKSVVSSVLDEEVDDQVLQKLIEDLRNPENVYVEPKILVEKLPVPFSFENMKPIFLNKDDIFDKQKHVIIECVYSILEEMLNKITEENSSNDESVFSNEESELPTHQLNETFIRNRTYHDSYQEFDIYEEIERKSEAVAQDVVNEFFDSFVANEMSFDNNNNTEDESEVKTDDTFTLQTHEALNMAFVENSRSSSPVRENTKIFDTCDESPIVNTTERVNGDELSVLYEKEDFLLGSPFIKRKSVISMSQSFHSGGMKYWVSFDENLTENQDNTSKGPRRRCSEDSTPSFIAVKFNKHDNSESNFDSRTSWDEHEVKRAGVLCESLVQPQSKSNEKSLYSIANDSFHTACASNSKSDSFKTCEGYRTPIDESKSKVDIPGKVLLYDSSKDSLHTTVRPYRRQYSSWPPFEETLFYRLISKFRMSESFDPSDLENCDSA